MNSVQMHLALTHVPVILSLAGAAMLIVALLAKNKTLIKTAYVMLVIAGITALPVYFSGEGAEEAVENLPGVSETIVERHEDIAKAGLISIVIAGLLAIAAFFSLRFIMVGRIFKVVVLGAGLVSSALMFQTAKLGGEIRHTEVSNATAVLDAEANPQNNEQNMSEEDDD